MFHLRHDQSPTTFRACLDQNVPVAAAAEFGADTIAEPGIFAYLASITFCAIIATGYSERLVRCLLSGKATEAAAGMCADSRQHQGFCYEK
jgi:hypothetical protein